MNIIEKNINELKAYANNPRHNEKAVDAVAASIKEFGFKVPVVVDKDGVIAAGHTRVAAAKKLGIKTVPCIVADDLTEEQIRAFRLADNKTAELAEWDEDLLALELEALRDFQMEQFGFDDLLNQQPETEEPNFEDDIEDDTSDIPKSHIYIYTCSIFGTTDEKLFEYQLTQEEADKLIEHLKTQSEEEAGRTIRGLINAI